MRLSAEGRGGSVTCNQPHKLLFTSWAHQPAGPSGTWLSWHHGNCEEVPSSSKNQRTCPAAERMTMETHSAHVFFQILHHGRPHNAEFIVPILQMGTHRPGFVPWVQDKKLCDFGEDD